MGLWGLSRSNRAADQQREGTRGCLGDFTQNSAHSSSNYFLDFSRLKDSVLTFVPMHLYVYKSVYAKPHGPVGCATSDSQAPRRK